MAYSMTSSGKAWVTLLSKINYLPGTLALHMSLKLVESQYPLVVMVTSDLAKEAHRVLEHRSIRLRIIDVYPTLEHPNIQYKDARFAETWTKLKCFELTEYDRVVLLDSDMIVRKNMDELMEIELRDGWIAAAHVCACNPRGLEHYPRDWVPENCPYSWPDQPAPISDCHPQTHRLLNSGTVVLRPSTKESTRIATFLSESPLVTTFVFPDQELLAVLFKDRWNPLPYTYNALKTSKLTHPDLWNDDDVQCLHYILADKPWCTAPAAEEEPYATFNNWWWDIFLTLKEEMHAQGPPEIDPDWRVVEQYVIARKYLPGVRDFFSLFVTILLEVLSA